MKAEELKKRVAEAFPQWRDNMIAELKENNGRFGDRSAFYARKMTDNLLAKYHDKIDKGIDGIFLMLGDENGEINIDTLVDDLVAMVKESEARKLEFGPVSLSMGGGEFLKADIKPIVSLFFGDISTLRVNDNDITLLKDLLRS